VSILFNQVAGGSLSEGKRYRVAGGRLVYARGGRRSSPIRKPGLFRNRTKTGLVKVDELPQRGTDLGGGNARVQGGGPFVKIVQKGGGRNVLDAPQKKKNKVLCRKKEG